MDERAVFSSHDSVPVESIALKRHQRLVGPFSRLRTSIRYVNLVEAVSGLDQDRLVEILHRAFVCFANRYPAPLGHEKFREARSERDRPS